METGKYTLQERQGTSGLALCKDGTATECPFQPPLMVQSKLGQATMLRIPCNTNCALMKTDEHGVSLFCGASAIYYSAKKVEKEKPSGLKIT